MENNNSKHKLRGIFNKSLMNEVAKLRDEVGLGENEGLVELDRKGLEEEKREIRRKWVVNHSERALGGLKRRFEYELLYGKMNIDIKPKDGWLPKTPSGLLALIDSLEELEEVNTKK